MKEETFFAITRAIEKEYEPRFSYQEQLMVERRAADRYKDALHKKVESLCEAVSELLLLITQERIENSKKGN